MQVVQDDNSSATNAGSNDGALARPAVVKYGDRPKKPGLYLGLFHGRADPRQTMDGWGFNGPAIGPLRWCHTTYAARIKIEFEEASDAKKFFRHSDAPFELPIETDMVAFDGKYYGDWTVYYVKLEDCEMPEDTFRIVRRLNVLWAH